MSDDKKQAASRDLNDKDSGTKPAGQDVGPPGERVDDEVASDEGKTTKRQE